MSRCDSRSFTFRFISSLRRLLLASRRRTGGFLAKCVVLRADPALSPKMPRAAIFAGFRCMVKVKMSENK